MIIDKEIIQLALMHYDLSNVQVTFLGQSQNTTFRVETPTEDKFLLRLHSGIEVADGSLHKTWRETSVIQSELLWLNAIAQDTELIVPQPVQNCWGEWVTSMANTELGSSVSCSLLRWVEGEHLDREPTPQQIWQLGVLMAQLHQHSSGWSLPSNFSRPTHDVEQIKSATSQLGVLVQNVVKNHLHPYLQGETFLFLK